MHASARQTTNDGRFLSERQMKQNRRVIRGFAADERGAVMTEYLVIVGAVGLMSIPALLYCGEAMARSFIFVQQYLLFPFP
jgi:Flp pilus assembly pilin Flp